MRSYWRKVIFSIPASIRGKKREKEGRRWEGSRGEGREHMKLVGGIWEELGSGVNVVKIQCMKVSANKKH